MNTADPIEFVVAALGGPKAAAVAGRRGTGLISFGLLDPTAWHALHDTRRHAAQGTPPGPGSRKDSYLVTSLHLLGEDEDPHGDAARDATGHLVLSLLAFAADTAAARPASAGQLGPEEPVGTRDDLLARITTLEQAGVDELIVQPVIDPPTEMALLAKLLT
ncbi:hypothetical protein ACFY41_04380 [Streptomyces syringium]|uniref:hypothetical protein n=1 Tax=Streptomyces syringium TaxID=76729 RepID=UPI0036C0CABF